MRFKELRLRGAYLVEIEPSIDKRGFFARTFCREEFETQDLITGFSQMSISFNAHRGTVRGMHFSAEPHAETKLIRCTAGAVYDVIIDLRRNSTTYLDVMGIELSSINRAAIYVPTGIAHGFQTLVDETEILYVMDIPYVASAARGIRWNDPAARVDWPLPISVISERDQQFLDWPP